jgi:cbb3-type cytochrome oxidase maturation protein
MAVIYVLLPLAVLLASAALWAFIRAVNAGQFDDLDTPAHRILHEDDDESAHGRSATEPVSRAPQSSSDDCE